MAVRLGGMLVYIGAALFIWSAVFDTTQAQDECDDCLVIGGMGFADHPTNCGMYIKCVPDGNGWIPYEKRCNDGMFWNAAQFSCQLPTSVTCPNDPCLNINSIGVPHAVYCGAYWVCENNRAQSLECCPYGQSYRTTEQRCTNSGNTCVSNQCHYLNDGTQADMPCIFEPVNGFPKQFKNFRVGEVPYISTCSEGTIWDSGKCTCDFDPLYEHPVYVPVTGADCLDLRLLLNVNSGFKDDSGKGPSGAGWYVSEGAAEIRTIAGANGNGALYCSGGTATYPSIPRYANVDFGYLRVDFSYLLNDNIAVNGDNRDLALFSNSMCDGASTVSISVNRINQNLQARVSVFGQATAYTVNVNPRKGRGGFGNQDNLWVDVSFVYTGATMSLTSNANDGSTYADSDSIAVAGSILTAPTGIRLCDGSGYRAFEGYLDDFTVYTCNPN